MKTAADFKQRMNRVDLQTLAGNSRAIFERLHRHEVDLAIMAGGWEEPGIDREVLLQDELVVVAAPGHPLAGRSVPLERLAAEELVLRKEGSSTRQRLLALFEGAGLRPRVGLTFASMEATIRAVETGYGVTALPSLVAAERAARGSLARVWVEGVTIPFSVFLCTRTNEPPSPVAERFIAMLRDRAAYLP